MSYTNTKCPKCGGKLMRDARGKVGCPRCIGKRMAEETFAHLKTKPA